MDLKESAHQLVGDALCEILARYTETEINEHIANIKSLLEMFNDITSNWSSAFPSVSYTLEQMLENLEFTKSDLE